MKPRSWSTPVLILVLLVVAAVLYALQVSTYGGWQTLIDLCGGAIILVLGVSLADRLMTGGGDR